jgi:hypothetical protein
MGICSSSKNDNPDVLNSTGPGLPPQEIIPQPVEVSNLTPDLNTQITTTDNPLDRMDDSQNQPINSIVNQNNQPLDQSINNSNPFNSNNNNINNSLNLNNKNNTTSFNNSLNLNTNNNLDLNPTINQNQMIRSINSNNINNVYNNNLSGIQNIGQSQGQGQIPYNSYAGKSQLLGNNGQPLPEQRVYIVVQLPQREIEITKLYESFSLADIAPYIEPDSIDEYDFYNDRGYSIDDFLYTPFNEWIDITKTLRIKLVRSGLHITNDIRDYISKRTNFIGCLTFDKPNTFGLFIFDKTTNSTLSFEYSTNIYLQLKSVNQFSAYCNALDKLYISGGEIANNQASNSFICVDLKEVQQNIFVPSQLCYLKKPRYWHSMIFIPENYIFIIGGPNETDVELYNIDTNISTIDSKLNSERCEPSLILVNNKFLYAIFGFHLYESFINTIERCNLHRKKREWEMVDYKLSNTQSIARAFFGVSYVSNNIILLSDKESQNDLKPNYILSPGRGNIDTISDEGILNSRSSRLFAEKFFIPFTETESINLAFKSGEPKIFIVNNENGSINELCLGES